MPYYCQPKFSSLLPSCPDHATLSNAVFVGSSLISKSLRPERVFQPPRRPPGTRSTGERFAGGARLIMKEADEKAGSSPTVRVAGQRGRREGRRTVASRDDGRSNRPAHDGEGRRRSADHTKRRRFCSSKSIKWESETHSLLTQ